MSLPGRPAVLDTQLSGDVAEGVGAAGYPRGRGTLASGSGAPRAPQASGPDPGPDLPPVGIREGSPAGTPGQAARAAPATGSPAEFGRLLHLLSVEKILRALRLSYLGFTFAVTLQLGTLLPGVHPAVFGLGLAAYFAGTLVVARPRFASPRPAIWLACADVAAVTAIFTASGATQGYAGPLYLLAFALAGARLPVPHALGVACGGMALYTWAAAAVGGPAGPGAVYHLVQQWLVAGGSVFFIAYLTWAEAQQRARKEEVERLLGDLRDSHLRLREYALLADRMAYQDALTGIYNYRFFQEVFGQALEREHAYGRPLSLLMVDIDHFKRYNDRCGHSAGNEVLKTVADLLGQATRERDVVCRFGGEEFAVILPGADTEVATKVAERIRRAVEATAFSGGDAQPGGRLTVSVGVATAPRDARTPEELVERADAALYAAKGAGRNRAVAASRPTALAR